jgi:hypothetical protein
LVALPIADRRRINPELLRHVLLEQPQIQPPLSDVIPQCFQVLGIGLWQRFRPGEPYMAKKQRMGEVVLPSCSMAYRDSTAHRPFSQAGRFELYVHVT